LATFVACFCRFSSSLRCFLSLCKNPRDSSSRHSQAVLNRRGVVIGCVRTGQRCDRTDLLLLPKLSARGSLCLPRQKRRHAQLAVTVLQRQRAPCPLWAFVPLGQLRRGIACTLDAQTGRRPQGQACAHKAKKETCHRRHPAPVGDPRRPVRMVFPSPSHPKRCPLAEVPFRNAAPAHR
jgi:hypothetical protein